MSRNKRDISEGKGTFGEIAKNNIKNIAIAIMIVFLIIIVFILTKSLKNPENAAVLNTTKNGSANNVALSSKAEGNNGKTDASKTSGNRETDSGTGGDNSTDKTISSNKIPLPESEVSVEEAHLVRDRYPQINKLIETYFDALLKSDIDTLNSIVNTEQTYTVENLKKTNEYIENYEDIICYTVDTKVDDTYIVYVYYKVKLINIDTPAPALVRLYICQNEQGDVLIYNKELSDKMNNYAVKMDENEDVKLLVVRVNNLLAEACEKDEKLDEFYNKISQIQ